MPESTDFFFFFGPARGDAATCSVAAASCAATLVAADAVHVAAGSALASTLPLVLLLQVLEFLLLVLFL